MASTKRLIWDIETSPNVALTWRVGYKISINHENLIQERAIICICYKWEGEKKVHHLEWDKGCDKKMVEEFLEVAKEADELIAHNGDKFDIKWLNTRILLHDLEPAPIWKTVDTLAIARRRFNFNSNRLDYLGQFLLGHGKIQTDFGMWRSICLDHCPKAMKKMVRYCKEDVRLLEKVWHRLQPFHTPKSHVGVMGGQDKWTCPWTGSKNVIKSKTRTTSAGTVQHQMQSKEKGGYYTISDTAYKEYMAYRVDEGNKEKA
jgi:hypothetical protein